ncbi:zinc finger protein 567-like isoform X2 [Hyperolius riggenbachi]|uniref:zinc finger protein 567-like isoform X2 n=1 Tax=Hyperolius riggenbachi TaxID=752182 RepID=UPI0035A3AB83
MMENQPPLSSAEGSSNRTLPKRRKGPRYSRSCTQKDRTVPHHQQSEDVIRIKVDIKEEPEDTYVTGDEPFKEEEIPSQISTDGTSSRDPEKCTSSPYSEDSTQDDNTLSHHYKGEDLTILKVEIKEEDVEMCVMDGQNVEKTSKEHSDYDAEDNDVAQYSPGGNPIAGNTHHRLYHDDRSQDSSNPEESSSSKSHSNEQGDEKIFPCPECDKFYKKKKHLVVHQRVHTGERPFSCSDCGKSFRQKGILLIHKRSHTGERPFSCTDCGKCFTQKGQLLNHQRSHTGERPFLCSECGKCFTSKGYLLEHQRSHTV